MSHHPRIPQQQSHDDNDDDTHTSDKSMQNNEDHLYHFTAEKAGMSGIDKNHVQNIVHEMSKNSKYYKNARQNDAKHQERMRRKIERLENASKYEILIAKREAQSIIQQAETERRFSRVWVVVDMDMFFAAVEMRDNPELTKVPMAVGSQSMISTSNYLARKFGVRSAMPGFIGKRLCPHLRLVPPSFEKYSEAAQVCRSVFREYDPNFSAMSLDEAYLDMTEFFLNKGIDFSNTPVDGYKDLIEAEVKGMRERVKEKTNGLTCSAGIACNTMLAKIASDFNKPDGHYFVPFNKDGSLEFIADLPVRKIPGIGKVTEQTLKELGISTAGDVPQNGYKLCYLMTPSIQKSVIFRSLGIARDEHSLEDSPRKSISAERTFRDEGHPEQLKEICWKIACKISERMRCTEAHNSDSEDEKDNQENSEFAWDSDDETFSSNKKRLPFKGKTVTIKIKLHDFSIRTRAKSLHAPTNDSRVIFQSAWALLKAEFPVKLRLLGIKLSQLVFPDKDSNNISRFFSSKRTRQHWEPNDKTSPEVSIVATSHGTTHDVGDKAPRKLDSSRDENTEAPNALAKTPKKSMDCETSGKKPRNFIGPDLGGRTSYLSNGTNKSASLASNQSVIDDIRGFFVDGGHRTVRHSSSLSTEQTGSSGFLPRRFNEIDMASWMALPPDIKKELEAHLRQSEQ